MDIVAPLNAVVSLQEHSTVSFGSYPVEGHPVDGARTVVTLEVRVRVRVRGRGRVRVRARVVVTVRVGVRVALRCLALPPRRDLGRGRG